MSPPRIHNREEMLNFLGSCEYNDLIESRDHKRTKVLSKEGAHRSTEDFDKLFAVDATYMKSRPTRKMSLIDERLELALNRSVRTEVRTLWNQVQVLVDQVQLLRKAHEFRDVESVVRHLGLEEAMAVAQHITKEIFGSQPEVSVTFSEDAERQPYLVLRVHVGTDADPDDMVDLQSRWYDRVIENIGEDSEPFRLVVEYQ